MAYSITTNKTWHQTQIELEEEFRKWGVKNWNTNYPKGARSAAWSQSEEDRTVTLEYWKNGKQVVLQMGNQKRAVDNLRVLFLAVQAMRMNEKRGINELISKAYLQLDSGQSAQIDQDPYSVLGVYPGSSLPICEAAYKELVKIHHPDVGGNAETFQSITHAINTIRSKNL